MGGRLIRPFDWRWLASLALPVALLASAFAWLVSNATQNDWLTYVRGADAILAGTTPYAPFQTERPFLLPETGRGLGYPYPPAAPVVMAPFLHPFELWAAVSFGLFLAGLLAVLWRHDKVRPLPVATTLLFTSLLPPMWDGISGGSISIPLAGMLGLTYAGAPLAGLAAVFRMYPASWILLGWRQWRWTVAGGAVPVLLSIALAGFDPWIEYVEAFDNMRPACGRFLPSHPCLGVPTWVAYLVGAGMVVGTLRLPRPWLLLALGMLPLVISPQVGLHYLSMAVPGIVAVYARFTSRPAA